MSFLLLLPTFAAEPAHAGGVGDGAGMHRNEVVIPWSALAFQAARTESPAVGPDLLAVGTRARVAMYDAVDDSVTIVGAPVAPFSVGHADGLAVSNAGQVVVLDDSAREVRVYAADGGRVSAMGLPGVVPADGTLAIDGQTLLSVDIFGNGHRIATLSVSGELGKTTGPAMQVPTHDIRRSGGTISVDGREVATRTGRVGARSLGRWLLVEAMDEGTVTRDAILLSDGTTVSVPVRGRMYAPRLDIASAGDGTLAWMDPRDDGLHVVTVTP